MESELLVKPKKKLGQCGNCKNYDNFNCKIHNLKVYTWEKYPCEEFQEQSIIPFEKENLKIERIPLYKRDISKFEFKFKLHLFTRILINLKKHKINPYIFVFLLGTGLTALNFYFSILDPNNGRSFSIGILFANLLIAIGPSLGFYYAIEIALNTVERLREILSSEDIKEKLHPAIKRVFSRKYLIISVVIMVIMAFWINSPYEGFNFGPYYYTYFFNWLIIGYMLGCALWILFNVLNIEILISKLDLKIDYLNSDGYGGLKFLGDLSLKFAAFLNLGALLIPMSVEFILEKELPLLFKFIAYFSVFFYPLIIICAFIIPMIPLNSAAHRQKDELLLSVLDNYRISLNVFYFDPNNNAKGTKVLNYRNIVEDIKEMKVWPLNTNRLIKLVGSALIPVILATFRFIFPILTQLGI